MSSPTLEEETPKPQPRRAQVSDQRLAISPDNLQDTQRPVVSPENSQDTQRPVISPDSPQDTQRLGENWKQILAQVRQRNPNTYALLNSCRTRHLRGNVLILGFASELLKAKMERSDNVEIVRRVLEQVIGQEISIRCQTTTGKQTAPPPEVDNDGMVAAALRDLGGEIVDIQ